MPSIIAFIFLTICLASFCNPTYGTWVGKNRQQDTILDEDGNEWAVVDGDSLDFRGRELRNAAIVDSSIDGIKHLTVESIAIRQASPIGKSGGHGPAIIDSEGVVATTPHMRWNEESRELKIPAIGSFSKQLEVRSDIDFMSHTLRNVKLDVGTELEQLVFKDGIIANTVLRNVTASDLNLGDVTVEAISIKDFASSDSIGAFVTVSDDGTLDASSSLKSHGGQLLIDDDTRLSKSLKVDGDLRISGEAYLEGSLAVAGSVLGGGPYVDISDRRFKRNIQQMDGLEVLNKLLQLEGVSYELDTDNIALPKIGSIKKKKRQIGFIAQEVETLFPELVYNDDDNDFKGLHYSRFVPLLLEGIKQLSQEVRELQELVGIEE